MRVLAHRETACVALHFGLEQGCQVSVFLTFFLLDKHGVGGQVNMTRKGYERQPAFAAALCDCFSAR